MNSVDAAAILGLTTGAHVGTVHAVYRERLAALDPSDPTHALDVARLRAARDILASRASNAFKDKRRPKSAVVHFPPGQRVRPEPARTFTAIPWPQCRFVPSRFFETAGQVLRVMDANNLAIIDVRSRAVVGTLARHPRRPDLFCFRRLDRSFGDVRGERFFSLAVSSIEPMKKGGA